MEEVELIRLMKELMQLLQNISDEGEVKSEDEIAGRVEAIKRELGAWFIDDYQFYQAFEQTHYVAYNHTHIYKPHTFGVVLTRLVNPL